MEVRFRRHENVDLRFTAPPSKSYTHRALVAAALAEGDSRIISPLFSDDTLLTCQALRAMGVVIYGNKNDLIVEGCNGHLPLTSPVTTDCGNSGTTMRFMTSVALLADHLVVLRGSERMHERPVAPLVEALRLCGGEIEYLGSEGCPPLRVGGRLRGGSTLVDASVSSQFISSLLMAAPCADHPLEVALAGTPVSRPYVDMTLEVMEAFGVSLSGGPPYAVPDSGYRACDYRVPGDYSSASYLFAIAAVCGGRVCVQNLDPESPQPDRGLLDALSQMGCDVSFSGSAVTLERNGPLSGIDIDMSAMPDTVQTLAAVAAFAETPTHIRNISHLRYKESDRIRALFEVPGMCGPSVYEEGDGVAINRGEVYECMVDPRDDHRTAMSAAVLGLGGGGVTVKDAECVSKSFPEFWKYLSEAGL